MTCNNCSFSLTMVTPTSHFFAFHWLCCLLPIGYLPKPGSVDVRICHYHRIQPRPQVKWYSNIFDQMHLFSTSTIFTAPVGMVTFRQSPCWYYPWADAAVSTSSDTQHLWTWWHFSDHAGLINISVNNIRRIHIRRVMLIYYMGSVEYSFIAITPWFTSLELYQLGSHLWIKNYSYLIGQYKKKTLTKQLNKKCKYECTMNVIP